MESASVLNAKEEDSSPAILPVIEVSLEEAIPSEAVINIEDEEEDDETFRNQSLLLTMKSEGLLRFGDCESDPHKPPAWVDRQKLDRARQLFKRDLFGLFFNHLCGLYLLFHVSTILKPLLVTRNSRSVAHLFRRYLSTLSHVKLWYEGDIWKKDDPAQLSILTVSSRKREMRVREKKNKALIAEPFGLILLFRFSILSFFSQQVRRMHKKVADKINAEKTVGIQELGLSQYDMLITQVRGFLLHSLTLPSSGTDA